MHIYGIAVAAVAGYILQYNYYTYGFSTRKEIYFKIGSLQCNEYLQESIMTREVEERVGACNDHAKD